MARGKRSLVCLGDALTSFWEVRFAWKSLAGLIHCFSFNDFDLQLITGTKPGLSPHHMLVLRRYQSTAARIIARCASPNSERRQHADLNLSWAFLDCALLPGYHFASAVNRRRHHTATGHWEHHSRTCSVVFTQRRRPSRESRRLRVLQELGLHRRGCREPRA